MSAGRRKPPVPKIDMSEKSHALEVPDSLEPLLAKANRCPVALSRNGKTAAFLVGARDYQEMKKFAEEMAEDRYWTKVADKAMKEGSLSVKESEEFLTNMRKRLDSTH